MPPSRPAYLPASGRSSQDESSPGALSLGETDGQVIWDLPGADRELAQASATSTALYAPAELLRQRQLGASRALRQRLDRLFAQVSSLRRRSGEHGWWRVLARPHAQRRRADPRALRRGSWLHGIARLGAAGLLLAALGLPSRGLRAAETPSGEFRVNTTTAGLQIEASVARSAEGDYVVAWQGASAMGTEIYAQRYAADGTPQGGEILVNTYLTSTQGRPSVAMDDDGGFVVVWHSTSQDGSDTGVYAQRFDAEGTPQGAEFRVNTTTAGKQYAPTVAMDADGDFLVAWQSYDQDGEGYGIFAQRYHNSGLATGVEFQVNTYSSASQNFPSVAMDSDGDFVVVWQSYDQDGAGRGIYAQRFSARGIPQGAELQVNSYTTGTQSFPSVAMDRAGDFVITWQSHGQDGDSYGIFAQRFQASGTPEGGELQVNTFTVGGQSGPSAAMDAAGNLVIAWQSHGQDGDGAGIFARRYQPDGTPHGGELPVNEYGTSQQFGPAVALDTHGDMVVVWNSSQQAGSSNDVYARQYAPVWPASGEFQVNTLTLDNQRVASVAMDDDGDYVLVWQSEGQDGDGAGIFAQRYQPDGTPRGSEFQVNSSTSGDQAQPSVAMNRDGNFVVVWHSLAKDGATGAIIAQRYAADGAAQDGELAVSAGLTYLRSNPSIAMDSDGDFVVAWQSQDQDGDGVYARRFAADGSPLAGELRVNSHTSGDQAQPSVAINRDGNFVVVWQSYGLDGDGAGIYAQRFAADGRAMDAEFQVNIWSTGQQQAPAVAMDRDGNFVVVWQSYGLDGDGYGVSALRYAADGTPRSAEFQVNNHSAGSQAQPSVAMDRDGRFVVVWHSQDQDGSGYGIYSKRYGADLNDVGDELRVNFVGTLSQSGPAVAMDQVGNTLVAWQSEGQDGAGYGIFAQHYQVAPQPAQSELRVSGIHSLTKVHSNARQASDAGGAFVVVWQSHYDQENPQIYAQRYSSAGVPQGEALRASSKLTHINEVASVAMDADGDFVITWQGRAADNSEQGIYAQRYAADGSPNGGVIVVLDGLTYLRSNPSIAMDSDGDFVITWQSQNQDGDDWGVYAQRYRADGTAQGAELRVNTYTTDQQQAPSVAMDDNGDFVVVWQSYGQDGDDWGVYAQRYNADGVAQGVEFRVSGGTLSIQSNPILSMGAGGQFVVAWSNHPQDGTPSGVYAQIYDAAGAPVGGERVIFTGTLLLSSQPALAVDDDGDFVVSIDRTGATGQELIARRFNADGSPMGEEFLVSSKLTSVQLDPSVAMDSDGDFVISWQRLGQGADGKIYAMRYGLDDTTISAAPTLATLSSDAVLSEPGSSGSFTITLDTIAPSGGLTISYSLGGTATPGVDYTPLSGSVFIPEGESSATITITPLDDMRYDPGETIVVMLDSQDSYLAGWPRVVTLTIGENDPPGRVWLPLVRRR